MKYKNYGYSLVMVMATFLSMHAHDVILEAKGAYFLATNKTFKQIYDKGGGIYGAELTFGMRDPWYGFGSVDFFSKQGKTVGFCSPTKVSITALAFGVKYLMPFEYGDVYVGLGVLPTHVTTQDCSPFVAPNFYLSKWGCGGIGKLGAYFNMPQNFTFNIFYNYSFVHVGCVKFCGPTQPRKADLSGSWFGVGLGYRFGACDDYAY